MLRTEKTDLDGAGIKARVQLSTILPSGDGGLRQTQVALIQFPAIWLPLFLHEHDRLYASTGVAYLQ